MARKGKNQKRSKNLPPSPKLFVGGIPAITREEEISEYFTQFGKVSSVKIQKDKKSGNHLHNVGKSRGFAFVTFEELTSFQKALSFSDQHKINDSLIDVKNALTKKQHAEKMDDENSRKIFVFSFVGSPDKGISHL